MVVLSLTSIPPRFKFLPAIVQQLLRQNVESVYVVLPRVYDRFPGEHDVPDMASLGPRVKVLRPDKDLGPATKFLYTAKEVDGPIIYVDDDTKYPDNLADTLTALHANDPCVWGLSGFLFAEYFSEEPMRRGHGREVDVIEGYGGVIIDSKIVKKLFEDICSLLPLTYNDDMILSNLLDREGVPKKTAGQHGCHLGLIQQYAYGFTPDALHFNNGDGGHKENNRKIINSFIAKDCYYFKMRGC